MDTRHFLPHPTHIKLADKPLALGSTVKKLTLSKFLKDMDMKAWSEGIDLDFDLNEQATELIDWKMALIERQLRVHQKKLVVCFINQAVGYGLFTKEAIPKGQFISVYAGKAIREPNHLDADIALDGYKTNLETPTEAYATFVDAKAIGNLSRFIQHAPSAKKVRADDHAIDDYAFQSEAVKNTTATANVSVSKYSYQNKPHLLIQTIEDIAANQQILWNYGLDYWHVFKKSPMLFDKKGNLLDTSLYHTNRIKFYFLLNDAVNINLFEDISILEKKISEKKNVQFTATNRGQSLNCVIAQETLLNALKARDPRSLFLEFDLKQEKLRLPEKPVVNTSNHPATLFNNVRLASTMNVADKVTLKPS